ncbi:MAG: type II CAAX prenyl endopeptidase Rce1 family protein [Myxococcota bacterium]
MTKRDGHGWGAYFWPYVSFLLIVDLGGRFFADFPGWLLLLKVAVPFGLFLGYYRGGHYSELRGNSWTAAGIAQDIGIGLLGAAVWMAPYILIDSIRPVGEGSFDPEVFGASLVWLALGVRAIGYGVATPFIEELFVRSWLARYVEVLDGKRDFRDVAMARYSRLSFGVVVVWFVATHVPWEWPVALAWIVGTQLWFYHRRQLASLVIVHASSNLSILAFVALGSDAFVDGRGNPIGLWFFV